VESVYSGDRLYAAEFESAKNVLHSALGGLRSRRMGDAQPDHLDANRTTSLALLSGSNILITGDLNGLIHIWSLDNWQELATLSAHRQYISGLAFSPDGSSLLSISTDGTIHLWGLPWWCAFFAHINSFLVWPIYAIQERWKLNARLAILFVILLFFGCKSPIIEFFKLT